MNIVELKNHLRARICDVILLIQRRPGKRLLTTIGTVPGKPRKSPQLPSYKIEKHGINIKNPPRYCYYDLSIKWQGTEPIPELGEGTTTSKVMQSPGWTTWVKAHTRAVFGISFEALTATTTFSADSADFFSCLPRF